MFRFVKATSANPKIGKLSVTLTAWNFPDVICDEIWFKVRLVWSTKLFFKGIYNEKTERKNKNASRIKYYRVKPR